MVSSILGYYNNQQFLVDLVIIFSVLRFEIIVILDPFPVKGIGVFHLNKKYIAH